MADISSYFNVIRKAPYGENVRDAITNASQKIAVDGKDFDTLSKKHAKDLYTLEDVQSAYNKAYPIDDYPTQFSSKLCSSAGLYELIGDLSELTS